MRAIYSLLLPLLAGGCGTSPAKPVPAAPAPRQTAASAALPPISGPKVENPRYLRWAKHPVGTTVVMRDTTTAPMTQTAVTTAYKLTALTEDRAIVEVSTETRTTDGHEYPPSTTEMMFARWVAIPEGRKEGDLGKPQGTVGERKDSVAVLGKEYAATCYKSKGRVEAGETITETWIAEDFPGGIVKSVHAIPAGKKTVASEVVRVDQP